MVAPTGSLAWRKEVWVASLALSRHVICPLDATAKVWMTGPQRGREKQGRLCLWPVDGLFLQVLSRRKTQVGVLRLHRRHQRSRVWTGSKVQDVARLCKRSTTVRLHTTVSSSPGGTKSTQVSGKAGGEAATKALTSANCCAVWAATTAENLRPASRVEQ